MNDPVEFGTRSGAVPLPALTAGVRLWLTAGCGLLLSACGSKNVDVAGGFPPPHLPPSSVPAGPTEVVREKINDDIGVGDQLELFVKEDPSYNSTYVVRERGDIILPQLGRIPVAGMSVTAAQQRIETELEKHQLTSASVILDRVSRANPGGRASSAWAGGLAAAGTSAVLPKIAVYMTGKVNRPGQHLLALPANQPLGVYEAILISGGISRFGDERKVHVMRTGNDGIKHRIPVDLRLIEKGKAQDPPIGDGDIVVVPEKIFGF